MEVKSFGVLHRASAKFHERSPRPGSAVGLVDVQQLDLAVPVKGMRENHISDGLPVAFRDEAVPGPNRTLDVMDAPGITAGHLVKRDQPLHVFGDACPDVHAHPRISERNGATAKAPR